ncbi:50S ribosomal protein L6 [uncultured bacterium]|nr:50S ribosomal protein L6 [uncultured bacterium]
MSRIGKKVIEVPASVQMTITGNHIKVKGPKGELESEFLPNVSFELKDGVFTVLRENDNKINRSVHGLTRSLVANMIEGVVNGFSKTLDIVGVGYKVEQKGENVLMNLGYSHPIYFMPPTGITLQVTTPNQIVVSGIDKQLVGQIAAKIRSFKEPEPYKGKGIKYSTEVIRRKAGKTAGK